VPQIRRMKPGCFHGGDSSRERFYRPIVKVGSRALLKRCLDGPEENLLLLLAFIASRASPVQGGDPVRDLLVVAIGLGLIVALVALKEAFGLPCWISRLGINFRPFSPPTIASLARCNYALHTGEPPLTPWT